MFQAKNANLLRKTVHFEGKSFLFYQLMLDFFFFAIVIIVRRHTWSEGPGAYAYAPCGTSMSESGGRRGVLEMVVMGGTEMDRVNGLESGD